MCSKCQNILDVFHRDADALQFAFDVKNACFLTTETQSDQPLGSEAFPFPAM